MNNINTLITELVKYGTENGLVDEADKVYVTNTLLETLGLSDYEEDADALKASTRSIQSILDDILDYAKENEICELDTVTQRDLFDTKNAMFPDGSIAFFVSYRHRSAIARRITASAFSAYSRKTVWAVWIKPLM